jgi:hypothetical protein
MPERRNVKRFRALDGALVALCPASGRIGQILNIGLGGLSFRYIADPAHDTGLEGTLQLQLMFAGKGIWLKNLSARWIADIEIPTDPSFAGLPLRQTCLQFVSLTHNQKSCLETYIQRFTDRAH